MVDTLPTTPTPQEQLNTLRTEIQRLEGIRQNAPQSITDNDRNLLRTRRADLRQVETQLTLTEQQILIDLDTQIINLTAPPPPPEQSASAIIASMGMPMNTAQTQQLEQGVGIFKTILGGAILFLGKLGLGGWARDELRKMGLGSWADKLKTPEEKQQEENEKKKKADEAIKQANEKRKQQIESTINTQNLDARKKKAYAGILIKAFYEQIGASVPAQGTKDDLTYARHLGTELAIALDEDQGEKFDSPCALELSGDWLQATDTHHGLWSAVGTLGARDHDIPGMEHFGSDLKNNPEKAFKDFLTIKTGPLDTKSRNKIDSIQSALLSAQRTLAADLQPAPEAPNQPRAGTPPRPASAPAPAPTPAPSTPNPQTTPTP